MRRTIALTGVGGMVNLAGAETGIKLGRKHRFAIGWTADIPLNVSSGNQIVNCAQMTPLTLTERRSQGPCFS